jgi:hypothetical protein
MRIRTAARLLAGSVTFAALVAGAGMIAAPAGAHSKSGAAKTLTALTKKIKAGKKATYQAVYSYKSTGTKKVSTITFAQKPPKSLFEEGTTHTYLIDTGTQSLECSQTTETTSATTTTSSSTTSSTTSTSATATTTTSTTTTTAPKSKYVCVKTGSAGAGAASGLLDLFEPTTALTYFNTAEQEIAAKIAGYSVKITNGTYGGVASKCVTLRVSGQSYKYCVGNNGLLTYSGTPNKGYFELKSFTKNVPASDFQPPAGAKTETIP